MATYKDIAGTKVQNISGDPTNPVSGQMWYNETSNTLKGIIVNPSGSWATGPTLNNGRSSGAGGGTSASAIVMSGYAPALPSPEASNYTEVWNGSSFSTETANPTSRFGNGGTGASGESAIVLGGTAGPGAGLSSVATYNGSSWTEVGEMITARDVIGNSCAGTVTAAIVCGGRPTSNKTELWNGTSWSEVNELLVGATNCTTIGSSPAAISCLGQSPNTKNSLWNGTSWTESTAINNGRTGGAGAGTATAAVISNGNTPSNAYTEVWNGSSWSEDADSNINNATDMASSKQGTSTSFLWAGKGSSPFTVSEQWTGPGPSVVTITSS
jgi:hypothetical protein|tara:strand:+ start:409 stop:1389 length:981 start_codon:yes stop_codon:yes gene_type:complete